MGRYRISGAPVGGPLVSMLPAFEESSGTAVFLHFLPEVVVHAGGDVVRNIVTEAKSASAVRDPGVLRMMFAGSEAGRIYLVTEAPPHGQSAADIVHAAGVGEPREVTRWVRDVARALTAVHKAGLVHRDVRPENIHVADDGSVRLASLGLVRAVEEMQEFRLGLPIASPACASPEYYRGAPLDGRADVYSLGAAYFHLLTGRPAFTADTSMQVLHKHATEPVPDICELWPHVPAACGEIIRKAMAKEPAQRQASCAALADDLQRVLDALPAAPAVPARGRGVFAGESSSVRIGGRSGAAPRLRSSAVGWAAAGLATLVLVVAAVLIVRSGDERPAPPPDRPTDLRPPRPPDPPDPPDPPLAGDDRRPVMPPVEVTTGEQSAAAQAFAKLTAAVISANEHGDVLALEDAARGLRELHDNYKDSESAKEREFARQALAEAKRASQIPEGNGSVFVWQKVPDRMAAGKTYEVELTFRNFGTKPWAEATAHHLGSQNPQDNKTWGLGRVALDGPEVVSTGSAKTFRFTVTAPAGKGVYNFQWRMVQDGVQWFGAFSPNVAVTVEP